MKNISGNSRCIAIYLGINVLTGEACAFNMRLLCDVNEKGRALLTDYLGLAHDTKFNAPMNSTVAGEPTVGSIMLRRDIFRGLAEFYLWREGADCIVARDNDGLDGFTLVGLTNDDIENEATARNYVEQTATGSLPGWTLLRNPRIPRQPAVGSRNVHAMTGRTV